MKEVIQIAADFYQRLLERDDEFPWEREEENLIPNLFSKEDVELAINQCDFKKGLGTDKFDEILLKTHSTIKDSLTEFLTKALNSTTSQNISKKHG